MARTSIDSPNGSETPEVEEAASASSSHPRGAWIPLGRVAGIRLFADPMLFVALGLLYLLLAEGAPPLQRLLLAGIVLASVLIHELGHALVARLRGLRVGGIYLHLLPFAYVQRGSHADVWRVALGGPAMSLAVGGALFAVLTFTGSLEVEPSEASPWLRPFAFAAVLNLAMGAINLLPTVPLDGGRALAAVLRERLSKEVTRRVMVLASVGIGGAIACLAFLWPGSTPWLVAIGAYIVWVGVR